MFAYIQPKVLGLIRGELTLLDIIDFWKSHHWYQ